jgi:hypothetical protein
MPWFDWLLSSRSSTLAVAAGVPRDALDTVARAMSKAGLRLVSDVAAPQATDYRVAAMSDRLVRFEAVKKPRNAEEVHWVVVRQKDDRALGITVGFGRARGPQVVGGVMLLLIAAGAFVGRDNFVGVMMMLYYPLAMALALLVMPGKVNSDAVKGIVKNIELALEGERARAADSVRRRVEAPLPVAEAPDDAEPADGAAATRAARVR